MNFIQVNSIQNEKLLNLDEYTNVSVASFIIELENEIENQHPQLFEAGWGFSYGQEDEYEAWLEEKAKKDAEEYARVEAIKESLMADLTIVQKYLPQQKFDFYNRQYSLDSELINIIRQNVSSSFLSTLYSLAMRIAGRSPAFEGIRLVKERIK